MTIYELLKKYPAIKINISYDLSLRMFTITLKYLTFYKQYMISNEDIELYEKAVYVNIVRDFEKGVKNI